MVVRYPVRTMSWVYPRIPSVPCDVAYLLTSLAVFLHTRFLLRLTILGRWHVRTIRSMPSPHAQVAGSSEATSMRVTSGLAAGEEHRRWSRPWGSRAALRLYETGRAMCTDSSFGGQDKVK